MASLLPTGLEENIKGVSVINENPIDVVEKLGKYEFTYDFSNKSCSGGFVGGFLCLGKEFSKGDVIDVIRFETPIVFGGTPSRNAIIKINNNEESSIPKDYLSKVDDSTPVTVNTGINFGANIKPQTTVFVSTPIKPITNTVLEDNATYYLTKDFTYFKNAYCPPYAQCMPPPPSTILSGSKVTGTLIRRVLDAKLNVFNLQKGISDDSNFVTLLVVSTPDGNQNIPLEYLTKDAPKNIGSVVSAKNDNKNLLMILGVFVVGYALFSNNKSSN